MIENADNDVVSGELLEVSEIEALGGRCLDALVAKGEDAGKQLSECIRSAIEASASLKSCRLRGLSSGNRTSLGVGSAPLNKPLGFQEGAGWPMSQSRICHVGG